MTDTTDNLQPRSRSASVLRKGIRRVTAPVATVSAVAALIAVSGLSLATSAVADCSTNTDTCTVDTWNAQTPLGPVDITVSPTNVVTVHMTTTNPYTWVIGIPFALPPAPPTVPGYTRTTVVTTGGTVSIDTLSPPGPSTQPGLAIIGIHSPSPCRANTTGTTVVFTPRFANNP